MVAELDLGGGQLNVFGEVVLLPHQPWLVIFDILINIYYILKERKIDQRLPRLGGNVKLCMPAYDINITAYTR